MSRGGFTGATGTFTLERLVNMKAGVTSGTFEGSIVLQMTNDPISTSSTAEAEHLRATERKRLRALVEAEMTVANQLHADDFQLINPLGGSLSKEQYLGGIASGTINYLVWEPDEIAVRMHGDLAILRYQAQMEIIVGGQQSPPNRLWHMDAYEKRNGRWQVVWSQATEIRK